MNDDVDIVDDGLIRLLIKIGDEESYPATNDVVNGEKVR